MTYHTRTHTHTHTHTLSLSLSLSHTHTHTQCYTPESNTVSVCLPGSVGVYKYVHSVSKWQFLPDVRQAATDSRATYQSRAYSRLISKVPKEVSAITAYAALAVSPCSDYAGRGRAGGDLVCHVDGAPAASAAYMVLGGGTISKMPSIDATSRPSLGSLGDLQAYEQSLTGENVEYKPRKPWQKVDLSNYPTASLPARFGHAMASVSGSRVLIYGGIGCSLMDKDTGFCTKSVLLNDLWELDLLRSDPPILHSRSHLFHSCLTVRAPHARKNTQTDTNTHKRSRI